MGTTLRDTTNDYYRIHADLRAYFHTQANQQRSVQFQEVAMGQARIEEAYHALALGDPNPAIALGIFAQQSNLTLWGPLLEAVAQAPTELMPDNGEQRAYDALVQAERHHNMHGAVSAIILYTWLLTISRGTSEIAYMQNNLGNAYSDLPGGDREANLSQAIACYQAALEVYTREAFPVDWAMTQNNLGNAYSDLPGGDREANLSKANIGYQAALEVFQSIGMDSYPKYILEDLKQAQDALQSFGPPEHFIDDFLQKLNDIIHQMPTLQNVLRETSNVFGHYILKPRCKTVNARLIEACSHIHEFAAILDQPDDLKVKAHRVWLTNALLEFSEQAKVVEASISQFCDMYGSLTAMNQPVELRKDIQQQLDVLMNRSESVLKNAERLYNELRSR